MPAQTSAPRHRRRCLSPDGHLTIALQGSGTARRAQRRVPPRPDGTGRGDVSAFDARDIDADGDNAARRSRSSTGSADPALHQPAGRVHRRCDHRPQPGDPGDPRKSHCRPPTDGQARRVVRALTTNAVGNRRVDRHRQRSPSATGTPGRPLSRDQPGQQDRHRRRADHPIHARGDRRHLAVHLDRHRACCRPGINLATSGAVLTARRPRRTRPTSPPTVTDSRPHHGHGRVDFTVTVSPGRRRRHDRRDPGHRRGIHADRPATS